MYDIIGDIHGHARELIELLTQLDYQKQSGVYRHASRQAVFVGDLIDRGPQIPLVVEIVRKMVDAGTAHAVMGNHEYNAIGFHTPRPDNPDLFFRPRNEKNIRNHQAVLDQFSAEQLQRAIEWFKTLPVALELDGIRVVHASWQSSDIEAIRGHLETEGRFTTEFLMSAYDNATPLARAIQHVLKGPEIRLPEGVLQTGKDGTTRKQIRTRWFESARDQSYLSFAVERSATLPPTRLPDSIVLEHGRRVTPYPTDSMPVFVGHYWLSDDPPMLFAPNVACVDYSIAKDGHLAAYRWDGERQLDANNFVRIRKIA